MIQHSNEHFRVLLLQKRHDVLTELGLLKGTSDGAGKQEMEIPSFSYSFHMAEQSSITLERETTFSFMSRGEEQIHVLNDALKKLESGTYGLCESCGKPIADARLEAMPDASFCIACQVVHERRRPVGV